MFEYLFDGIQETVQILYTTFYREMIKHIGSPKLTLSLEPSCIRDSLLNLSLLCASKSQVSNRVIHSESSECKEFSKIRREISGTND